MNNKKTCLDGILKNNQPLKNIIHALIEARDHKKKIFIMGNGGSASTASHFCSDLLKTAITKNENRFQVFSLTDNLPVILAWANDTSYDEIFVEQLKNSFTKNDILIGFSGSGNSKNLIKAFQFAKKIGAKRIGLTGRLGGLMKKYCDLYLQIPSDDMLTIESQHVIICHCIVTTIRNLGNPVFKY